MNENYPIELNLEDEAVRMSELTGVDEEVAYAFVLAEDKYFDLTGVNVYVDEAELINDAIVDVPDMLSYIASIAGLDIELCERLEDAERKYYREIGVIAVEDYEGEFV